MPRTKLSWDRHKRRWLGCQECELCDRRHRVVLGRGKIPCDVLFIGEAPGQSEDTSGKPFVGKAGRLLDQLIYYAERDTKPVRKFFTNLISCIPLQESGSSSSRKANKPPNFAIKACTDRLNEVVELTRPQAVVMVGNHAQRHVPKIVDWDFEHSADIVHPGSIIRLSVAIRSVAERRVIVTLSDLFREL